MADLTHGIGLCRLHGRYPSAVLGLENMTEAHGYFSLAAIKVINKQSLYLLSHEWFILH
jgi:hypothetical protein